MKKTLVALFTMIALSIGVQASFAACPCQNSCDPCVTPCNPCAKPCDPCAKPCKPCETTMQTPCCEEWLSCAKLDEYFCKIGLSDCQKADALKAVEEFKCATACMRANGCDCESKCDCRTYRKALRTLDCSMKQIITKCQKSDYKSVKKEVKNQVKCCHHCLINPFSRCKCACK